MRPGPEKIESGLMGENELLKTALHSKHVAMEATMGTEGGWEVPLSYRGALEEVGEVRGRAGVFDVSHFGRIRIRGDGAIDLLERACTADVAHQEDDTTISTLLCNERGGIIDRCRLIRLTSFWVLIASPVCREKVLRHLTALGEDVGAKVDDQTPKTTMLEAAGPATGGILDAVLPFRVADLAAGSVRFGSLMIARYIAEQVSVTGQWGVAVSVPNMVAAQAWRFITGKAGINTIPPCGLAARDVLRIEAGIPRYGHEINETLDPATAGLIGEVDFGHDFLGAEAVKKSAERAAARELVGLILEAPKEGARGGIVPGQGMGVCGKDGTEVGTVTSGAFSPTLEAPIALAYVATGAGEVGDELLVDAGGRPLPARVTPLPFVRPPQ